MVSNFVDFYLEDLLESRPNPKLEDHTLSAVRDGLFSVLAATLRFWKPFLTNSGSVRFSSGTLLQGVS